MTYTSQSDLRSLDSGGDATHNDLTVPPLPTSVRAARLPCWNATELLRRHCPVCGSDSAIVLVRRPDDLTVSRCSRCQMLYLAEIPSPEALSRFYSGYAVYKNYTSTRLSRLQLMRQSAADPYISILRATGGIRAQRLLEIGCSYGRFLQLARYKGAEVAGVEVDAVALKHVVSSGIRATSQIPESGEADIVCAFQVMEHLADPASFVRSVAASLSPDGRFLVTLPNGGEAESRGHTWIGFRVDFEHVNYFTESSLGNLLGRFGLLVEHAWMYAQPEVSRDEVANSGLARRLSRVFDAATKRSQRPHFPDGTFVLAALARKASSAGT